MRQVDQLSALGEYSNLGREHEFILPTREIERLADAIEAASAADRELRAEIGAGCIHFKVARIPGATAAVGEGGCLRIEANSWLIMELARKLQRLASPEADGPDHLHLEPWFFDELESVHDIIFERDDQDRWPRDGS